MNHFFSIDSKFFHFMTHVADCMILGLLWYVFSLPVITSGAATAAVYYTVVKVLRNGEGSLWNSFWSSFKANLKQGILITIPALFAGGFWVRVLEAMAIQGQNQEPLYIAALVLLSVIVMWLHYIFSYLARFQDTIWRMLRNTFLICLGNFPGSLLMLALFVTVIVALYMLQPINPILLLFVPSLYIWIVSLILERIYSKYNQSAPEDVIADEV